MALPDFTVATPPPTAGASNALMAGQLEMDRKLTENQTGLEQGYNTSVYTNRTVPQLQGSIAAQGRFMSTARQNSEQNSYEDFVHANHGLESAAARHMADLIRQRTYASIGLMI